MDEEDTGLYAMTKILELMRKVPWYGWVIAVLAVIFLFNVASAQNYAKKLFNMALDQLREDQSEVVATLEENQKAYEAEIMRLANELETVKKKQGIAQAETQRLRGLVNAKQAESTSSRWSVRLSLSLLIPVVLWMSSIGWAIAQPVTETEILSSWKTPRDPQGVKGRGD